MRADIRMESPKSPEEWAASMSPVDSVCGSCGAVVRDVEQHAEWHRWLWDQLGMSASS